MTRSIALALLAATAVSLPGVAFAQDQSAVRDLMKPGAQIFGNDGKVLGTIASINGDTVALKSKAGPVNIPRNWISLGSTGLFVDKGAPDIAKMAKQQAAK